MLRQAADLTTIEAIAPLAQEISEHTAALEVVLPLKDVSNKISKNTVRSSLQASTLDGVFATVFSNITGGVLLSNFLLEQGANPLEISMLASIPMLANLIQPLGAYLANRTTSRHWYSLWVYTPARLLWLILVVAIAYVSWYHFDSHLIVQWTLGIVLLTHMLGGLGSASWLTWLAALVPRRLRGRYFSIRNIAASLTSLICVPLLGWGISVFPGGTTQGYSAILLLAVIAGLISLGFQWLMADVDPQADQATSTSSTPTTSASSEVRSFSSHHAESNIYKNPNFLTFLFYFSFWTFAVNVSAPFFNIYMLDNLSLDISWVTLYNSLTAGANLLMLVLWGKLADRVGNRPILVLVGILVAITPLLWLAIDNSFVSIWFWLPLIHILSGGTWAAIDLCNNNIQMGVAPVRHHAACFAVVAAVSGVSGALGTTVGGLLAQFADYGGLSGLFALSSILRLLALLPLLLVREEYGQPLKQVIQSLFPTKPRLVPVKVASLGSNSKLL